MKLTSSVFDRQIFHSAKAGKVTWLWQDLLWVGILALVAGLISFGLAQSIAPILFENPSWDVWFESDLPRSFANTIARSSNHYRTSVHPIFSLIAFPPTYILYQLLGDAVTAVRIIIALVASIWISILFCLLRLFGCRRLEAILFSLIGIFSAAAIFWFSVPETYSFGSVSILLPLVVVAIGEYRQLSPWWYLLVSALSLSITTTNWMAGILATFVNNHWKQAVQITVNTFCFVVGLWFLQYLIFPSSEFFLKIQSEKNYVFNEGSVSPWNVIQSFIAHTMVMPAIEIIDKTARPGFATPGIQMVTQLSLPGSASLWGKVAVILWAALLGLGIWGFLAMRQHPKLRLVLGLTILGQLVLHLLYGEETFLYSLHFAPLLVILASCSTLTRARPLALVLASLLLVCIGINNISEFNRATERINERDRQAITLPASSKNQEEAGYHRLGGSFSPPNSSFGISFWIRDREGNLQTTSDNLAIPDIRQELVKDNNQNLAGIETTTDYYQAFWSVGNSEKWQLNLKNSPDSDRHVMLALRSIGATKGEIRSLEWDGRELLINELTGDRWILKLEPAPTQVYLGKEKGDWMMAQRRTTHVWEDWLGLGYALFDLNDGNQWNLTMEKAPELEGEKI
ncbi:MAG: hypothetical protein AB4368_03495 [Xenococcaceae cyanobacterium]